MHRALSTFPSTASRLLHGSTSCPSHWRSLICLGLVAALSAADPPVTVVAVGGGSVASAPTTAELNRDTNALRNFLTTAPKVGPQVAGRPIPTNDWWTYLLTGQYPADLWAYPLMVRAPNGGGPQVFLPTRYNTGGTALIAEHPLVLTPLNGTTAVAFAANSHRVIDWGDWSVTFRQQVAGSASFLDTTLSRGSPYAWVEAQGYNLQIPAEADDTYTTATGAALTYPVTTDTVVVSRSGYRYAVFTHPAATYTSNAGLRLSWTSAAKRTITVAGLAAGAPVATYRNHAFAIPRDTRFTWSYNPSEGAVRTTYTVTPEVVDGSSQTALQGWLPHHWRDAHHSMNLLASHDYRTLLGRLRLSEGNSVTMTWDFNGMLPFLPLTSSATTQRKTRMQGAIQTYYSNAMSATAKDRLGSDTYWGGKELVYAGQMLHVADQLGSGSATLTGNVRTLLREVLVDWLTYTPGETKKYFANYPSSYTAWTALVGFNTSYGSAQFNDHHFHYGYFTYAAALLGAKDPAFLTTYGPLLTQIAKEYANWDRTDTRFPVLRCFDPWIGHSYAGGKGDGGGNNQESSSEAMQGWGGQYLLGAMLGDQEMMATGAMGYAIESRTIDAYWNDYHGWKYGASESTFDPKYPMPVVGILRDNAKVNGLYWSGPRPLYVFGIQWLPLSPIMQYLGRDPAYHAWLDNELLTRSPINWRESHTGTYPGWKADFGGDWGNVYFGYLLQANPTKVVNELDASFVSNDDYARWKTVANTYAQACSRQDLGQVAWDMWTGSPMSTVYRANNGTVTAVVYNPGNAAQTINVYQDGAVVGTVTAQPGSLGTATISGSPVVTAPVITTQPSSRSVTAGTSTTFAVVATGTNLTYQWRRNGAAIAGATTASYTLTAANADNAVAFSVVVTNSAGSVTSANAVLTVTSGSTGGDSAVNVNGGSGGGGCGLGAAGLLLAAMLLGLRRRGG